MVAKIIEQSVSTELNNINIPSSEINWSSVKLSEVKEKQNRLEASIFDIKVRAARQLLNDCSSPVVNFWSDNGPVRHAQYPGRFKRIYVNQEDGFPFYLPSQISDLNPRPTKWISPLTHSGLEVLEAHEGELLINRSGTIGPVTIVSKTLDGKILSDDIIRVIPKESFDLGYLYAFLHTQTGQVLLTTNSYGAVISHIEPDHLHSLPIPMPEPLLRININKLISDSFKSIDKSNELIQKAEKLLYEALELPEIHNIVPEFFVQDAEVQNYQISLSNLKNRFDASFHVPIVKAITNHIDKKAEEVTTLGNKRISSKIILPGRFKRVYVDEGQGVVFVGGKQIYELDPSNKKYLSFSHHGTRIKEQLSLLENMIVVTCSGTIGRVNIIPKHWENWTMNQHVLRIVPINDDIAGYIYTWLNSDYGYQLISHFTYGAVVDEITDTHLSSVPIPILKDKDVQKEINNSILEANKLRYMAYENEQKAIKTVDELVIHNSQKKLDIAAEPSTSYNRNNY